MSKRSRTKGASFERELANRWRDSGLFPDAKRGIGQARSGEDVADVEGSPFWPELKHRKAMNIRKAMIQAEEATDGRTPLVVARYHGDGIDKALVCMRLSDWEQLVSAAEPGTWEKPVIVTRRVPDYVLWPAGGGRVDAHAHGLGGSDD